MHTLTLVDGWIANFNGDLSGDVLIRNHDLKISADIPGIVLKSIIAEWVRLEKVRRLEDATDGEILLGIM